MKKVFNLSVILAVLMAAFSFTSCSDDDDDAKIEFSKSADGKSVTITAEAGIQKIEIEPVSAAGSVKDVTGSAKGETTYKFSLENYEDGKYKITVTDKDDNKAFETVTVGASQGGDDEETPNKNEVSPKEGDVISWVHNGQKGQFFVLAVSDKSITLANNIGGEFELSDAGTSYLSVAQQPMKLADAKSAGEILIAKVNGKAVIAGGASSMLDTKFEKNATKLTILAD